MLHISVCSFSSFYSVAIKPESDVQLPCIEEYLNIAFPNRIINGMSIACLHDIIHFNPCMHIFNYCLSEVLLTLGDIKLTAEFIKRAASYHELNEKVIYYPCMIMLCIHAASISL